MVAAALKVLDPEGGPSHNVSKQNCLKEKAVHPAIHSAAQKDSTIYNAGWGREEEHHLH